MPNELRVPELEFLEEEDIFQLVTAPKPKKTEAQRIRETKLEVEQKLLADAEAVKEDELL